MWNDEVRYLCAEHGFKANPIEVLKHEQVVTVCEECFIAGCTDADLKGETDAAIDVGTVEALG